MNNPKPITIVDTTIVSCFKCSTKVGTTTYWNTSRTKCITVCDPCSQKLKLVYGY